MLHFSDVEAILTQRSSMILLFIILQQDAMKTKLSFFGSVILQESIELIPHKNGQK